MSFKLARTAVWLAAVAVPLGIIAELASGRWQGCGELGTTAGENVALVGTVGDTGALLLAAWSIAWARDWRTARLRLALTTVVAASLVVLIVLYRHHPYGPGCG